MKQKDQLSAFKAKQELIAKRTEIVKKDNRLVLIASAVAIVLAVVSQAIYFNFGPGASQNNEALPTETEAAAPENSDQVPSPDLAEGRTWVGSMNLNDAQIGFELDGA
ncbi:MAG: hypothetical protein RIS51_315, partial [Actinomycetota bacterium]